MIFRHANEDGSLTTQQETNTAPKVGERAARKRNKQHAKAVKIFVGLFVIYLLSYIPMWMMITDTTTDYSVMYLYYINHVSNFFVYAFIDQGFRSSLKQLTNV